MGGVYAVDSALDGRLSLKRSTSKLHWSRLVGEQKRALGTVRWNCLPRGDAKR